MAVQTEAKNERALLFPKEVHKQFLSSTKCSVKFQCSENGSNSTPVAPLPAHAASQDRRTCIKKESEEASNPEITHVDTKR